MWLRRLWKGCRPSSHDLFPLAVVWTLYGLSRIATTFSPLLCIQSRVLTLTEIGEYHRRTELNRVTHARLIAFPHNSSEVSGGPFAAIGNSLKGGAHVPGETTFVSRLVHYDLGRRTDRGQNRPRFPERRPAHAGTTTPPRPHGFCDDGNCHPLSGRAQPGTAS